MKSFSKQEKYHHAAYAYFFIGIVYTFTGAAGMPPHDYGALIEEFISREFPQVAAFLGQGFSYATALRGLLTVFGLLFFTLSYFIYKGYRKLVLALCAIYLLRLIFSGRALVLSMAGEAVVSDSIYFLFPMLVVVFCFLVRAGFHRPIK